MEDPDHGAYLGGTAERAGNVVNQPAVVIDIR
jgi:hypothetical protein